MVLTARMDRWFDDRGTAATVEDKHAIVMRAALDVRGDLSAKLGDDPNRWDWGAVHRHTFVSPIRREGFGKGLLGGGTHPAPGSVETLYRGLYAFEKPFDVTVSAALRMVADLGGPDKVLAVLPGGVAGRVFHPHATDQIEAFMDGEKRYWWFSDREIEKHTQSVLTLQPQ